MNNVRLRPATEKKAHVVILGAGIAGLSMALGLKRRGFTNVEVIEAFDSYPSESFAFDPQPDAMELLDGIGIDVIRRFDDLVAGGYAIRQIDLRDAILSEFDETAIRFGMKLPSDGIGKDGALTFASGEIIRPDFVIGADGQDGPSSATFHPGREMWSAGTWVFQGKTEPGSFRTGGQPLASIRDKGLDYLEVRIPGDQVEWRCHLAIAPDLMNAVTQGMKPGAYLGRVPGSIRSWFENEAALQERTDMTEALNHTNALSLLLPAYSSYIPTTAAFKRGDAAFITIGNSYFSPSQYSGDGANNAVRHGTALARILPERIHEHPYNALMRAGFGEVEEMMHDSATRAESRGAGSTVSFFRGQRYEPKSPPERFIDRTPS